MFCGVFDVLVETSWFHPSSPPALVVPSPSSSSVASLFRFHRTVDTRSNRLVYWADEAKGSRMMIAAEITPEISKKKQTLQKMHYEKTMNWYLITFFKI